MTFNEWIQLLGDENALPTKERPWKALTPEQRSTWSIFHDWLQDQEEDALAYLVEMVGWDIDRYNTTESIEVGKGYLRPYKTGDEYIFLMTEGGWLDTWGSYIPDHLAGNTSRELRGPLVKVWQELFLRVRYAGRSRLPTQEAAATT